MCRTWWRSPGGCCVLEPGGTNRFDPCHASGVCAFDTFPTEAVVHRRNHPCRDENDNVLDIPCNMEILAMGLKSGVLHRTCPSMTRTYDSVRSKDAVTLRPKYNCLNQYSLNSMNERCGDLVSRTCLAGAKSATSHSARNSMTLFSSLGRASWTA